MGGLRTQMPLTFWVFLIGALALSGIFPLVGFFSKDSILGEALHLQVGIFIILTIAAFFTAFYMGRQVLLVFFGQPRSQAVTRANESPAVMSIPLLILAILSAFGGLLNLPTGWGGGNVVNLLSKWLNISILNTSAGDFNVILSLATLALVLLGLVMAYYFYGRLQPLGKELIDPLKRTINYLYSAFENKWWVDELYNFLVVKPFKQLSVFLAQPIDQGLIDGLINGAGLGTKWIAARIRGIETGFVRSYALVILFGAIVILGYLLVK
jgi:NADH-quinone oxidoreductase subunit L